MSLCESCYAPGQCCKYLNLYGGGRIGDDGERMPPRLGGRSDVTTWAEEGAAERQMAAHGLPFVPVDVVEGPYRIEDPANPDFGRQYVRHAWRCPRLSAEGRCTDYENRPKLCRIFAPAEDQLCVHWRGAEGGDASASLWATP